LNWCVVAVRECAAAVIAAPRFNFNRVGNRNVNINRNVIGNVNRNAHSQRNVIRGHWGGWARPGYGWRPGGAIAAGAAMALERLTVVGKPKLLKTTDKRPLGAGKARIKKMKKNAATASPRCTLLL